MSVVTEHKKPKWTKEKMKRFFEDYIKNWKEKLDQMTELYDDFSKQL